MCYIDFLERLNLRNAVGGLCITYLFYVRSGMRKVLVIFDLCYLGSAVCFVYCGNSFLHFTQSCMDCQ